MYGVSEQGVGAWLVVHRFDGGAETRLAVEPPLRPARSLGGGSWAAAPDGSWVVYVAIDGDLWWQPIDGAPARRLTQVGDGRGAMCPVVAPDGDAVVYVVDMEEVRCIRCSTGVDVRLDDASADFVLDPWVDATTSTVQWTAWNVPAMPWDHGRVQCATLDGVLADVIEVPAAVQQPRTMPDGRSVCIRDDEGWLDLWIDGRPVLRDSVEHAGPTWGPGQCSYAVSPDGTRVAVTANEGGFGRLRVVDLRSGEQHDLGRGVHGQVSWAGDRIAALRTGARTPTQVVVYDAVSSQRTVVSVGPVGEWTDDELPEPELVELASDDGAPLHARLFRAGGSDRLLVWLHGGPTDQWQVTWMPRIAHWCSRGWNVLVPDHRGSTGHGRTYQQALQGRWGELDVADTLAVVRHAHAVGLGSPSSTVVMGGSAGGFTALESIAADPARFAAGVVLYPVTDLADLAERSHRFERHYTDGLVGPLPQTAELHRERSPLHHVERYVSTPLLVLHGENDPVVPVDQSLSFVSRLAALGGIVELKVYAGEGHGFRRREHQLDEYHRISRFLDGHVRIASQS